MTDIQSKLALANQLIDQLYKEKPFKLYLTREEYEGFFSIFEESTVNEVGFMANEEDGYVFIEVNENADQLYHMLSTFIAKHEQPKNCIDQLIASGEFDKAFKDVFGLPESVVKSLGEVS